jgi:hypothetical protein
MVLYTDSQSPEEIAEDDLLRSRFMKRLIADVDLISNLRSPTPRVIVQFWDDAESLPADVKACVESWKVLERCGFRHILFDDSSAERFIRKNFGATHVEAFSKCPHPAMRSDYFRLCYIALKGGIYIDADDMYTGVPLEDLIANGALILQSLCYDIESDSMLDPMEYASQDDPNGHCIFYVNNNPLIAAPSNPIVIAALERSTRLLLKTLNPRDVQSLTGPGNLSAAVVAHAVQRMREGKQFDFRIHPNWSQVAASQWPLDYRNDTRNWRNWIRLPEQPNTEKPNGVAS